MGEVEGGKGEGIGCQQLRVASWENVTGWGGVRSDGDRGDMEWSSTALDVDESVVRTEREGSDPWRRVSPSFDFYL